MPLKVLMTKTVHSFFFFTKPNMLLTKTVYSISDVMYRMDKGGKAIVFVFYSKCY